MHINTEVTMKSIALAVLIATLAGCAIVPYGYGPPPVYGHARGGYYDHGYRY
jgi:hypothetical protein